ncbi:hypothetical protein BTM29_04790 [Companilactobacillus allii]|uniref:Membrane protein 6-pyruvoyl-tetrahydropterin synthase-related domain-containing protein n=3 Tax=Companilactobacillus allii TaxID=1847728 RepID=A0A1P8Q210_9LACO|nr:hypothetical protein BTM29_04790 [Companilactobacillus allii]
MTLFMIMTIKRDFVWNGDDVYYQFQRIQNIIYSIRDAHTIPTISINNFGLIGYGINIFYPWVTLIPFALISFVFKNQITTYYVGIAFFFFASFAISHYSMKKFSGSTKQAIIFSILYNFSTYRLIDLIARASIAEYIATVFLPLCLLGFYEVVFGDEKRWQDLAIGISFVIFSHILTTFMTVILFALLIICNIGFINNWKKRIVSLGKAILATILATSIFWVPFLIEETFQKFGVPSPTILKGQNFRDLIKFSLANTSYRSINGNVYNLGTILLVILVVGVLFFRKFDRRYKIIYIVSVVSLFFVSDLFPWSILQDTPIQVIQYPFRILMFTTLLASMIGSQIVVMLTTDLGFNNWLIMLGIFTVVNGGMWMTSMSSSVKDNLLSQRTQVISNKMIDGGMVPDSYLEQYVPSNSQNNLGGIEQHLVVINKKETNIQPIITTKGNEFVLNNIKENSTVDLPVIYYKNTVAKVNGKRLTITRSKRGGISLKSKHAYKKMVITTNYQNKQLYTLIILVSLVAWIYMISILALSNPKK